MDEPMTYSEFIKGRVCKGGQARQDYEDYLKDFYESEDTDRCTLTDCS